MHIDARDKTLSQTFCFILGYTPYYMIYNIFQALNERANDCGILMVEIEAKSPVVEQSLASAREAIDGYESLNLSPNDVEIQTR